MQQIAQEQRELGRIKDALNARVETLTTDAMEKAKPHEEHLVELVQGMQAYAESHRAELTDRDTRKSVVLPTGTFGWRYGNPKVSLKKAAAVLEWLTTNRWKQFVRTTPEIDKEAMLRDPAKAAQVPGVSIVQDESFYVKPNEIAMEVPGTTRKVKAIVRE